METPNESTSGTTNTSTDGKTNPAVVKTPAVKTKKVAKPHIPGVTVQKDQTVKKKKSASSKKIAKKAVAKKAVKKTAKKITKKSAKSKRTADNFNRNFGRLKVNGEVLSKGRAVHAVVSAVVAKKKPTFAQLKATFPDELLKNYGIIQEIGKARKYSVNGKTRYFVGKGDTITTKDGKTVAVCNQFSTENVKPFIKHAKTLGFVMTPVK